MAKTSGITWSNGQRKLSDLLPWDINPVQMQRRHADGLQVSLHKFGFAQPLLVGPDGELYDGHQRQNVMAAMEEYGPDAVVDVRVEPAPDGGTVLLGGIKRLSEGRNEFGVPMLNKIPYVSRLFKNVGIGRETQSLMMMVTPRIIIQEEEEERIGAAPAATP